MRRFLPKLMQLIGHRQIEPGTVLDLELTLEQGTEGYLAMDKWRAIGCCCARNPPLWCV